LQSRNYNAVSMCVLAMVALMYPLEYMFPVIPLLPSFMPSAEQLLYAPTPFVIGLPASFFAHKAIDIPSDVIVVDLDTNQLLIPEGTTIPDIPEPDCTELKNSLRRSLGKLLLNAPEREQDNDENIASTYTLDSDVVDIAVRVAMIRFFNSANIFANFSEHTRTLRLYPRPVVALQTESFLRSRPQVTQFISELCK
uniref:MAP kinase-activating death domain protein n=1 Tax=Gongylonema pulchrum TaxID=637853 RepID=A0A183DAC4_9BILA